MADLQLTSTPVAIKVEPLPVVVRPVMDPELEECRALVNKAMPLKRFMGDGRPLTQALADALGIEWHKPYLPPCEHDSKSERACCPVPRGLVYGDVDKPVTPKGLTKAEADRLRAFADEATEKPANWYSEKEPEPKPIEEPLVKAMGPSSETRLRDGSNESEVA